MNPTPTGKPPEDAVLTGCVFAWDPEEGCPVFFEMPESPCLYLLLFETAEELYVFHARSGVPVPHIKRVADGREFLSEIPRGVVTEGGVVAEIKICTKPRYTPEGRVRFMELVPEPAS